MAKRVTVSQTKQMVEELLNLRAAYERYQELETQVKANMVQLKYKEIDVPGLGRVFIAQSERITVSPDMARDELGEMLAKKLIRIKEYVPNQLIKAFFEVGDISEAQREKLLARAEKTPVVSLYVRPLK